jgi:hypothetical protein
MAIGDSWGTQASERRLPFPCDRYEEELPHALYRGVSVESPPAVVFRWLCQMRVAPYSYDWIDNLGRRSPQTLTDGLDDLARGQEFMGIFELIDFEPDRHITIRTKPSSRATRIFGDVSVSYLIVPLGPSRCRLLAKVRVQYPRGMVGHMMRVFLPWGDLIMMRRQLLQFKQLAEGLATRARR